MNEEILTIIIPYHGEDASILDACLSSINYQKYIDFNTVQVIVCSNCQGLVNKEVSDAIYKQKNLDGRVKFIQEPLADGPGNNRQSGLNICTTPWVMFIDVDDTLYSVDTLLRVMSSIDKFGQAADIIAESSVEFKLSTLEWSVTDMKRNHIVWDKVYKTKFLFEKDIRFHPKLSIYEDVYFFQCCVLNEAMVAYVGDPIIFHTERDLPDDMSTFNRALTNYADFMNMRHNAHMFVNYLCQYADAHGLEIDKIYYIVTELYIDYCYIQQFLSHIGVNFSSGLINNSPEEFNNMIVGFYGQICQQYKNYIKHEIEHRTYYDDFPIDGFKDWVGQLMFGGEPWGKEVVSE